MIFPFALQERVSFALEHDTANRLWFMSELYIGIHMFILHYCEYNELLFCSYPFYVAFVHMQRHWFDNISIVTFWENEMKMGEEVNFIDTLGRPWQETGGYTMPMLEAEGNEIHSSLQ